MNLQPVLRQFGPQILNLAKATFKSGKVAVKVRENADRNALFGTIKKSGRFGNLDILTQADLEAEKTTIEEIRKKYPRAKFLLEEVNLKNPSKNYSGSLVKHGDTQDFSSQKTVIVTDPVDGTAWFRHNHHQWCVANGLHEFGKLTAGCTFAPEISGGLLAVGKIGKGILYYQSGSEKPFTGKMLPLDPNWEIDMKKGKLNVNTEVPLISRGISLVMEEPFLKFSHETAKFTLPLETGPCQLGLTLVACGKYHAFVHRPLPWHDLAAGAALIHAAGGTVFWYEIKNKKIKPLSKPNIFGETGIIAGHPSVVKWLAFKLINLYAD